MGLKYGQYGDYRICQNEKDISLRGLPTWTIFEQQTGKLKMER